MIRTPLVVRDHPRDDSQGSFLFHFFHKKTGFTVFSALIRAYITGSSTLALIRSIFSEVLSKEILSKDVIFARRLRHVKISELGNAILARLLASSQSCKRAD